MASSSVTYTSGTNNFNIPFPYLRDKHVIVSVGGTLYDIDDSYFTINTDSTPKIVLTNTVSEGTTVKVLRMSLGKDNDLYNDDNLGTLVDFVGGSVLTEKQQDESYLHNYYLNQESLEGNIKLGTPILDSDPATKGYVDSIGISGGGGTLTSVTAGNGLSGGTITTTGTVSIPTSGGSLNINSSKVGIAGDADSAYNAKITGDLLISDVGGTGNNAHLTLENTHTTDGQAIIKASAPGDAVLQLKDTATTGTDDAIYNVASSTGKFVIAGINDAETVTTTLMQLDPGGGVKFDQLPTSDPSVAGELWNDGGVVSVSGSSGFSGGVTKYDSGWVSLGGSTSSKAFTHGLGTTALTFSIWAANSSSGGNACEVNGGANGSGAFCTTVTTTAATFTLTDFTNPTGGGGTVSWSTYNYIRLVALG